MNDQITKQETAEILRLAEQAFSVDGDFVELGCYKGDTSVLLGKLLQKHVQHMPVEKSPKYCVKLSKSCGNPVENFTQSVENSVEKHLWAYDSFAGLPEKTPEDSSGAGANFKKGELLVSKREVIDKIRKHGLKNVIVKKAWFDQLEDEDLPEQIAFAFCDGDLYSSIKTSLKLVLPRLSERGIIVVHDYNNPELPGSARAVDEFLRAHPDFRLQVRFSLAILTRK